MRRFLAVLAFVAVAVSARGQQVGDPSFDTRVAHPDFVRRHPRVLFDEAHHNVHRTTTTYKAFADLLTHDGCRVAANDRPFTAALLAHADILVIAGALGAESADDPHAKDAAFTPSEVAAVRDWVRGGGALLLLTDHEPVASAEAELTRAFGVEPSRTVVEDRANHFANFYPTNILATRKNGLLLEHAITSGVRRVVIFGGQSLRFPRGAKILVGVHDAPGSGQAGALRFGRGRVVVTGDMGMLSAQLFTENGVTNPWGMNVPGIDNRELVLGIVRWLAPQLR
jgi:hypothetical protein